VKYIYQESEAEKVRITEQAKWTVSYWRERERSTASDNPYELCPRQGGAIMDLKVSHSLIKTNPLRAKIKEGKGDYYKQLW